MDTEKLLRGTLSLKRALRQYLLRRDRNRANFRSHNGQTDNVEVWRCRPAVAIRFLLRSKNSFVFFFTYSDAGKSSPASSVLVMIFQDMA